MNRQEELAYFSGVLWGLTHISIHDNPVLASEIVASVGMKNLERAAEYSDVEQDYETIRWLKENCDV